MSNNRSNLVLAQILEQIELPSGAYEKAESRYKDVGEWFHRPESTCVDLNPLIYSQGSFRLGTAIRPYKDTSYDLDMGCNLRDGLTKENITQKGLKELVGDELELYRKARNIKEELCEKKRCWRLEYADGMSFHMDVVPCIPETNFRRKILKARMIEATHLDENLATQVSEHSVSITDNTDPGYAVSTSDWRISNPEGYAKWFEARMKTAKIYLAERELVVKASIDKLPNYQWKTPLQSSIQLLKRHRDIMFKDREDSKPISVIITTLAARAYRGEGDILSALENILNTMGQYISQSVPVVPNPVNPDEDFADKWYSKECEHLKLKENFARWLLQAKADFSAMFSKDNSRLIVEAADRGLSINLDKITIEKVLGLTAAVVTPIKTVEASDPKPWLKL